MKRVAMLVTLTITVWLGVARLIESYLIAQDRSHLVPLTAKVRKTFYHEDSGQFDRVAAETVAVRADGSTVTTHLDKDPGGKPMPIRLVYNVGTGTKMTIVSLVQAVSTMPILKGETEARLRRRSTCSSGTEKQRIVGFDAVKQELSQGGRLLESWRSPELGCFDLKKRHYVVGTGGEQKLLFDEQVIELVKGEPDAALFQVPEGYREMSPSQLSSALFEPYPNVPRPPGSAAGLDEQYNAARKRAGEN